MNVQNSDPIIEDDCPLKFKNKVDNSWAMITENFMENLNDDQVFFLKHISGFLKDKVEF